LSNRFAVYYKKGALRLNKRTVLFISFLSVAVFAFPLAAESSAESSLYSEITSAYQSKSFPAVVEYASQLESQFPRSLFLGTILAYKGESLFELGRMEEADASLDRAILLCKDNPELQIASLFWKGRVKFATGQYQAAVVSFNDVCVNYKKVAEAQKQKTAAYQNRAFLYAAKSYFKLEQYDGAIPLLEFVSANGDLYTPAEYSDAFLLLFTSYIKTKQHERLVKVYEQLPDNADLFLADVYAECTLDAGESYEQNGQYKKAYECYSAVLAGNRADLAAVALQKAYVVSSQHQKEVGQDSGEVIVRAKSSLAEYSDLLSEFYVRLAIDAYTAGDSKKALSYFDNAEQNASQEYLPLIGLYRADMTLAGNDADAPQKALAVLDAYAKKSSLAKGSALYPEYEMTAVRCYTRQRNWNEVKVRAPQALEAANLASRTQYIFDAEKERNQTIYFYATACYQTNDFAKAVSLLADLHDDESRLLYARSLAKAQQNNQALTVFEQLNEEHKLDDDSSLDYAKVLLGQGFVNSAYKIASLLNTPESWYVAALASFDSKDWKAAEKYFLRYIASSNKQYEAFAEFYCGYAQYRLGKVKEAYKTLTSFTLENPSHELAWNAHQTAANAAVQNNNYDGAIKEAAAAVQSAVKADEKEQSIVLYATIYADSNQYDKAISVLKPYTSQPSDFGVRCKYQTAQIFAKQGNIEQSDNLYGEIAEQFKSNALADDAAYRRGEVYYSGASYAVAAARFDTYRVQFPSGEFLDASYFYEGDSLAHLGQNDRAVLMYLTLLKTKPQSSYCYTAKKNLVQLYRNQGEYNESLATAQSLITDYGDQAKKDGIPQQILELQKLAGGEDEQIVKQRALFEKNGGLATVEGRVAGTKLADMLWKQTSTQQEAASHAEKLFSVQSAQKSEAPYAAATALILAQNLRQQEKNKEAAQKYLSAAEFARMNKNDTLAARALYGAVESFDAALMTGDAKKTADTLMSLYPTSDYAAQAESLVSKY